MLQNGLEGEKVRFASQLGSLRCESGNPKILLPSYLALEFDEEADTRQSFHAEIVTQRPICSHLHRSGKESVYSKLKRTRATLGAWWMGGKQPRVHHAHLQTEANDL